MLKIKSFKRIIVKLMDNIVCPHCGKSIQITDAFKHQIDDLTKAEIEKIRKEEKEKAKQAAEEEIEYKLKNSKNEIDETKEKNKQLQEQLLELNKTIRELNDRFERKEIEDQKKLNEQIELIKANALKTASERAEIEKSELKKQLDDTKKALEDAQRKANQKSQQLQGEVLELNLEEKLKESFPFDEFKPVPKGVEGADIWQIVKNKFDQEAGSILWEIKRTKQWSNSWLPKLREDARRVNATISVLVTDILPTDINYFKKKDGVLITTFEYAVGLTEILRERLLYVAAAKSRASDDEKLQEIYEYISSDAFRHKFESHFESVKALRDGLTAERRAMEKIWKQRENQINKLDKSASQMFGDFQSVVPSLKDIKSLELGNGEENEEDNQESLL